VGAPKPPLQKAGHGYLGVMRQNSDGSRVQCHDCGGLYGSLQTHIRRTHGISAREYRDKYGLLMKTPLHSAQRTEKLRAAIISRKINQWLNVKTSPKEIARKALAARLRKGRGSHFTQKAEYKNKHGTCKEQLAQRIRKEAARQGKDVRRVSAAKIPSVLYQLCWKHFGTWRRAKMFASGFSRRECHGNCKWQQNDILPAFRAFRKRLHRFPYSRDLGRDGLPSLSALRRAFGNLNDVRMALGWPIVFSNFQRWKMPRRMYG